MNKEAPILIVGGGPVGLTLAIDLGQRGVDCILVERNLKEGILPKMELCNARSMEIFGRLGLADKIREAGWPSDTPMDVWVGHSLDREPYKLLRYPSVEREKARIEAVADLTAPREAYHRISQYTLERLLRGEAEKNPNVRVLFGHRLESFKQGRRGVEALVVRDDGDEVRIRSRYMVGCDGGGSRVRRSLGIELDGVHGVRRNLLIFFSCPDLLTRARVAPARHYYIAGERQATLVTQDDLKRWALHLQIDDDVDVGSLDPKEEVRRALGVDIEIEVLHVGPWAPHLVAARSYRLGDVFLAGDAAHQYIPTGGFGMNTGIGDADNLGWKLAATLAGWGGDALLDSYDAERRQIGFRNREASGYAAAGSRLWREKFSPSVLDDTEGGRAARAALVEAIDVGQRRSHEMHGIEMGYRYTRSPVCALEPSGPDPDARDYLPTTTPGARLPHAWLGPGLSVHDQIGRGMTLLVLRDDHDAVRSFEQAAAAAGIPLEVVRITDGRVAGLYEAGLLLVRPDLHVCWRGEGVKDASEILYCAVGRMQSGFDGIASTNRDMAATS